MRFYGYVVCMSLVLVVALASEVALATSEAGNEFSEALNDTDTEKRTYEGYQLVRVVPESEEHLQALRFIEKSVDSMWTPVPDKLDSESQPYVDMMVNPSQSEHLMAYLNCSSIPFEVVIPDIQRSIDTENDDYPESEGLEFRSSACQATTGFNFYQYQPASAINSYINCLARHHWDKAQYMTIGQSFEGRELSLLKIGMPSKQGVAKPVVWIDGGIVSSHITMTIFFI